MNQQSNDTQAAMVTPGKPPANGFVRAARKVSSTVGFSKGRNFVLWFVFAGSLMGFSLARLPYLDFDGIFCGGNPHAAPGECFYFRKYARDRVGIVMHLAAILPAGILVCFQFVPAIRHKFILVHRMNGYVVILLSVVGTVGGLMIARHTFGGGMASQSVLGFLSIIFLGALVMAYINIKLLQIEQHRAWMLRAWFYVGIPAPFVPSLPPPPSPLPPPFPAPTVNSPSPPTGQRNHHDARHPNHRRRHHQPPGGLLRRAALRPDRRHHGRRRQRHAALVPGVRGLLLGRGPAPLRRRQGQHRRRRQRHRGGRGPGDGLWRCHVACRGDSLYRD